MSKTKKMCCVIGCPSVQCRPREVLYLYPPSSSQRYKRWLTLYPNSFVLHSDKNNYICRRHFTPECFENKNRLKFTADPTINIDTSYAQDQILRTFLTKVIYEWSLRNNVTNDEVLATKALEVRDLMGMPNFKADRKWISKFLRIRESNVMNGVRFGTKDTAIVNIFSIIKDLRSYLPSNFTLPIDLMNVTSEGDQLQVKNECDSEDEDAMQLKSYQDPIDAFDDKDCIEKTEPTMQVEAVPQKALDTYQDALDLLKPLEEYITRMGNQNALARLREIETVVKEVVETGHRTRRATKRHRSLLSN